MEFPTLDERYLGAENRYQYAVSFAEGATREDDGYLLTVVSDLKQDASQPLVLDASGLDRIATVHLPHRVTAGIHGSWVPDDAGKDSEI